MNETSKKKVLFVYHYYAHYRLPVISSTNELLSKEHDVSFIGDKLSNEPSLITMDFPNDIDFIPVENKWLGKWLWQKNLFNKILKAGPSHIVFLGQFSFVSTLFCSLIFKLLGKKILFWGHAVYGNEKGIKKWVRYLFNLIPHKHLVYGNHAKNILINSGLNESKITVIYNSLDYNLQKCVLQGLNSNIKEDVRRELFASNPVLPLGVFIGRLTKVKNLEIIIMCLEALKNHGTKVNFLFIGEGPQRSVLQQLVQEKSLEEQVVFYGSCHDEYQIGRFLYSSDVCISPGNVGLTAIHSLSYGTPVITHNEFSLQMPEFEAIKAGITGDFFEFGSVESLCKTVNKWIYLDDNAQAEIYKNSIQMIDEVYNPANQAELIATAINDL